MLELDALKAQMNPHFVFNSLGAIQFFIQNQDVEIADDYLTKFAKLMRLYLDSAREKMITLEQELKLLGNYVALEQMRFENLFELEVSVDEEVETRHHLIPPMILQPFIENAINHGVSERKDKAGKIRISFEEIEEELICIIEDNGIGREKAKNNYRKGHQSRGMKIIAEKVDTLLVSGIADIHIVLEDAFPNNTSYPGTRVTIKIKNLENEED